MKNNKYLMLALPLFLLVGCSHVNNDALTKTESQQKEYINSVMSVELVNSSKVIQASLTELNRSNAIRFGSGELPFANIKDASLQKRVSVSYYGPIENILQQIAQKTDYKLQVFGKVPPFPVVVVVGKLNAPVEDTAINVLRDVAVQAAKKLTIKLNTKAKVISVRYADVW
ncbi:MULTISPECIES: DotD/TraH family lipoprotein [Cysteiniphilum]|uniref:DotD/TraH family lipoprotein n=1 Tax=Cysteiniphilum TaxID=2056696 RepID=UPI00177A8A83|nr:MULTISPECIES: DotD/TraH family lipoprotein [Cysteiniphilum]